MKSSDRTSFIQTGGARVGWSYWLSMNATVPFAKLTVSEDSLTLKSLGKTYTFTKDDIQKLAVYSGIFSQGVQVHHTISNYPKFIVFWTTKLEDLQVNLQRIGLRLD